MLSTLCCAARRRCRAALPERAGAGEGPGACRDQQGGAGAWAMHLSVLSWPAAWGAGAVGAAGVGAERLGSSAVKRPSHEASPCHRAIRSVKVAAGKHAVNLRCAQHGAGTTISSPAVRRSPLPRCGPTTLTSTWWATTGEQRVQGDKGARGATWHSAPSACSRFTPALGTEKPVPQHANSLGESAYAKACSAP